MEVDYTCLTLMIRSPHYEIVPRGQWCIRERQAQTETDREGPHKMKCKSHSTPLLAQDLRQHNTTKISLPYFVASAPQSLDPPSTSSANLSVGILPLRAVFQAQNRPVGCVDSSNLVVTRQIQLQHLPPSVHSCRRWGDTLLTTVNHPSPLVGA
ncbi:hypothetical protein OIDMADRAFT_177150 [Oidiodendron maius Zn]|uniref:Uncharacterized protein n=1 Tax=Oidiodendron maius (strain Zn) TaxID=913774 RepID=A0A0C3DRU9_OIDMZ|nr:hypothetical protein OIDMADRAFT_177150 [Oidiodendron maius Zn]